MWTVWTLRYNGNGLPRLPRRRRTNDFFFLSNIVFFFSMSNVHVYGKDVVGGHVFRVTRFGTSYTALPITHGPAWWKCERN